MVQRYVNPCRFDRSGFSRLSACRGPTSAQMVEDMLEEVCGRPGQERDGETLLFWNFSRCARNPSAWGRKPQDRRPRCRSRRARVLVFRPSHVLKGRDQRPDPDRRRGLSAVSRFRRALKKISRRIPHHQAKSRTELDVPQHVLAFLGKAGLPRSSPVKRGRRPALLPARGCRICLRGNPGRCFISDGLTIRGRAEDF